MPKIKFAKLVRLVGLIVKKCMWVTQFKHVDRWTRTWHSYYAFICTNNSY